MPSISIGQTDGLEYRDTADLILSPQTQQPLTQGPGQLASLQADGADPQPHLL